MDYLKSQSVVIQSLGEKALTIRELSAKAQVEFMETFHDEKRRYLAGSVTCKYGVPEWSELTPEAISEMLSLRQIDEITKAVQELSGIGSKNSESTLNDDSFSN